MLFNAASAEFAKEYGINVPNAEVNIDYLVTPSIHKIS